MIILLFLIFLGFFKGKRKITVIRNKILSGLRLAVNQIEYINGALHNLRTSKLNFWHPFT